MFFSFTGDEKPTQELTAHHKAKYQETKYNIKNRIELRRWCYLHCNLQYPNFGQKEKNI